MTASHSLLRPHLRPPGYSGLGSPAAPAFAALWLTLAAAVSCVPQGDLAGYSGGEPSATAGGPGQAGSGGAGASGDAGSAGVAGAAGAGGAGLPEPAADAGTTAADAGGSPAASDGGATATPASPRVLSTVPADGAAGVTRDATLSIAFDAPMDRSSVEDAFLLEDLAEVTPEFRWDAAGMLLNVVLDAPLSYATGRDPAQVAARRYSYRIGASAQDVDGNPLSETRVSFTTLREISIQLSAQADSARTGNWRSDGIYGTDGCAAAGNQICIGDSSFGPNASYRGFASFDLSQLPAGTVELSQASFGLQILSQLGAPSAGLGALLLEHVSYVAIGPDAFLVATEAQLGSVASVQAGGLSQDVLAAARSDWLGARPSQYRLRFASASDSDGATDLVFCNRASAGLSLTYLLP